ncbi:hypothetical protein DPMN_106300 [Dreissena polymorpha]|uniref:C17orf113 probable zinc finger domain-containing protein n=1 Tax=Dreissena polymorpha TaxID=45954 RepID=A0A9D4K4X0_DREPO|nr:hypothetical protein DPMN_106300 [Dreissena polymorpha]
MSILSFVTGGSVNKKKPVQENDVTQEPKKRNNDGTTDSPKKVIRKFKEEWMKSFAWLVTEQCEKDGLIMKCQWCANDGKTNVFATTGSNNYQKSALTRHEVHVDHVMVVNGRMAKAKKQTVQHIIEEHTEKVDSVNCESKTAQFRTLFFVANNGLPLDAHHGLIELQVCNSVYSFVFFFRYL